MIPRNLSGQPGQPQATGHWKDLDSGAPTISAFADLCRRAIVSPPGPVESEALSDEARAILICGGERGVVDVRASKDDYDSIERFLAICIETEPDSRMHFLQKENPMQTVAFLEGFAELCRNGLIIHHLGREFSFSKTGYVLSKQLCEAGNSDVIDSLMDFATRLDH